MRRRSEVVEILCIALLILGVGAFRSGVREGWSLPRMAGLSVALAAVTVAWRAAMNAELAVLARARPEQRRAHRNVAAYRALLAVDAAFAALGLVLLVRASLHAARGDGLLVRPIVLGVAAIAIAAGAALRIRRAYRTEVERATGGGPEAPARQAAG